MAITPIPQYVLATMTPEQKAFAQTAQVKVVTEEAIVKATANATPQEKAAVIQALNTNPAAVYAAYTIQAATVPITTANRASVIATNIANAGGVKVPIVTPVKEVTPPKPTKTQAQIYEENYLKAPTLAEWARLFGIPVEQAPFKVGEESRKFTEKWAKVTVTPEVPTPPAEAPNWLPIALLVGAAYLLTRRK